MKLSKKTTKMIAALAGAVALGAGVMTTTANADTVYTVQSGDTLSGIVQKFGLTNDAIDTIATNNHLANKNLIYVGEKLLITDGGKIIPESGQNGQAAAAATSANQSTVASATTTDGTSAAGAAVNNARGGNSNVTTSTNPAHTVVTTPAVKTQTHANNQTQTTTTTANTNNQSATTATTHVAAPAAANTAYVSSSQATTTPVATATPAAASTTSSTNSSLSGNEAAAREWIAARESGGSYSARNGQYIGRYQLSASYLNGDYSPANQDRVANQYVASRYGSWTNAQSFWQSHGWY